MKSAFEISDMKSAWQEMYRERTCPGQKILFSKEHAAEVAEHNKRCRFCAAESLEDLGPWQELGEALKSMVPQSEHPEPAEGQVWSLKEELGGWDDVHRYINPPNVLILEVFDDVGGVRVAQVFDASELCLDDDVKLEEYVGCAESWNTYALRREDLENCWGRVSGTVVQQVRDLAEQGRESEELEEDSIIYFFRQLELEVGARMAMQALPELMAREERGGLPEWLDDPKEVRGKVLVVEPRMKLAETGDSLTMLADMTLPEEQLAYAAADTPHQVRYNHVTLNPDEFNSCRSGLARLETQDLVDDGIHVEGWLDTDGSDGVLLAWWKIGETHIMGDVDLDVEGEYFEIDFQGRSEEDFSAGELVLLLLRKTDGTEH